MSSNESLKGRPVVPREYGARWIAWTSECTKIVGSAQSLAEVREVAIAAGETDPVFEWVPPAHARIVGVGR